MQWNVQKRQYFFDGAYIDEKRIVAVPGINSKQALHPNVECDLVAGLSPNFRIRINVRALPGGASLTIYICGSDAQDNPDPDVNRRDMLPWTIYPPNAPIQGELPVNLHKDIHHCE